MSTLREFFAMSGYGWFVWSSFAVGFGVVILELLLARSSLAAAQRAARRRLETKP